MQAMDCKLTVLLEGPKQFVVPVFQRDYSWGTKKHCLQLWEDILRVGADENSKAHFIGSVVYIAAEETSARISRWLLIDGQQRLTTVTLLLAALRNKLLNVESDIESAIDEDGLPTCAELEDYYLYNTHGKGDRRFKLCLRHADQDTLIALLEGKKELPNKVSEHILKNFSFFEEKLAAADLYIVYRGIKKLVTVDVCLARGQDDPQMIFESLNSTGLELKPADLIRNFVLMRQNEQLQTELYNKYWQPIERLFGPRYRTDFDKFVRDYLVLELRPSKLYRADEIYQQFRKFFDSAKDNNSVEDILERLKRFAGYYAFFSLGQEKDARLKEVFCRLRFLVEVASPLILRLYDCYIRAKTLTLDEFADAVELLESYVFRRLICAMQTRSLGQIFATLAYRVKENIPLLSLKVALYRLGKKRRFPTDSEFREALESRDVYDMTRLCHYLLERLENDSKERIDTASLTIEHVMPQNENLCADWREMLGPNWKSIQEVWLHRLGNTTLTGYNQSYSDRAFGEKKTIAHGFNESPLRLNKFIREQESWTAVEMESRGKYLAAKAVGIWPSLVVNMEAVKESELEEYKTQAAPYSLDKLEFDVESKDLFDLLRPQIIALGDDVIELCGPKSVTYRVYDFFVEVIPRKKRLSLMLNLDYEECDDPTQRALDATDYAFIVYASETGGVLFNIDDQSNIASAMHVIGQAYEKVSE